MIYKNTDDTWGGMGIVPIEDEQSAMIMIERGFAVRNSYDHRWWVDRGEYLASVATPTESLWLNQAETKLREEEG